ncbi:MAG: lysophospholipid acyltransferase family protein [Myxococcales bacterium]|nr:lysophospholipid acyltransferase family protein [Myxococcales bacterium]
MTLAFLLATPLLPLLTVGASLIDLTRWLRRRLPWVSLRMLAFFWFYLAAQVVGLTALAWVWLRTLAAGKDRAPRSIAATFAVQEAWASALFRAVSLLFGLDFELEGDEELEPGPYLVFIRHASVIDTLLPTVFVTAKHGIRLRFVLKRELLIDPCLDVAGQRLPNYFVQRSGDDASDVRGVAALASGLGPNEGVLIYPEGTRFGLEKHRRALAKLETEAPELFALAKSLTHVLPPRLGGALALLDAAPEVDAVFFAHTGLDGFASVRDIFRHALGRRRVSIKLWRVPRSQIPLARADRVRWLYGEWQKLNDWIAARVRSAGA